MTQPACASHPPEMWWPHHRAGRGRHAWPYERQAIAICHSCPVEARCLQHALAAGEREGIWGGLLPSERERLGEKQ